MYLAHFSLPPRIASDAVRQLQAVFENRSVLIHISLEIVRNIALVKEWQRVLIPNAYRNSIANGDYWVGLPNGRYFTGLTCILLLI